MAGEITHNARRGAGVVLSSASIVALAVGCDHPTRLIDFSTVPLDSVPSAITIAPASVTLHVGDSVRLNADSTFGRLIWRSSDPAVARVDSVPGWIAGEAAGVASVTV